jgi:hypothetical protein
MNTVPRKGRGGLSSADNADVQGRQALGAAGSAARVSAGDTRVPSLRPDGGRRRSVGTVVEAG